MADTKITDLTALTGATTAAGDVFVVVDVSDTTMAASGTDKKITKTELLTVFQAADADLTALAAAGNSTVLANTTASFTTADETKLDGIEALAEVNDTAAEILTKLLTVDGPGSSLDADLLDGNSSAYYAPLNPAPVVVSGTTDTLASVDNGKTNRYTNAAQVTVTIPTDASDDLVDGFWCVLFAEGAGGVTLSTAGITLVGSSPVTTITQNSTMVVVKTATANTWMVVAGAGGSYQPLDADLTAIAGLTSAADKGIQFTGSGTAATYDLTTAGKALLDDASASAQRTTLGLGNLATATTLTEYICVAISDETTAITTGTAKITFRMPFAMTVTSVKASLATASSSGIPTFDINESGVTILSTKLTIDANELTSTTAATAAVISDTALADDAEITIDVDVAGTGAKGAKVWIIGTRVV